MQMAENNKSTGAIFRRGLLGENPLLRLALGLCPALAVTTTAMGALGMGIATACALVLSNLIVALLSGLVSEKGRLPLAVLVAAALATLVQMVLKGWFPALNAALGIFVPLIAVNCLLLNRAGFAAGNGPAAALADGIGMGLGYICAMTLLGVVRELIGHGTLFGAAILPAGCDPMVMVALPAGGFMVLGILMGIFNAVFKRRANEKEDASA